MSTSNQDKNFSSIRSPFIWVGAHVSIAGGLHKSIENALSIGANTFQIFGSSPRTWKTVFPPSEEIRKYKEGLKQTRMGPVFLHAPYLVNLAAPDPDIWNKSVEKLSDHLKITQLLEAQGLVVHIGSGKGLSRKEAVEKAVKGIRQVFKNVPGKTPLIMENAAGGGDKIGSTLEDFREIFRKTRSSRLKICFDTAHALEAGWIDHYSPAKIKHLLNQLEEGPGMDKLVALHANDSKTPFQSHHDRHENIGQGYIGMEGFKNLAHEKRLKNIPWILEVPGFAGRGPDEKNILLLKSCFT